MLDLSVLQEEYLPIRMLDGEVINIKKPSQKMIMTISTLDKKIVSCQKKEDIQGVLNGNTDRLLLILNNNKENKIITREMVEEFTPNTMGVIVMEYMKWVQEINENPN